MTEKMWFCSADADVYVKETRRAKGTDAQTPIIGQQISHR